MIRILLKEGSGIKPAAVQPEHPARLSETGERRH